VLNISLPDENRFSSWIRLIRSTARVLLFIKKCRKQDAKLDCNLMKAAEVLILKRCQADSFASDLFNLKQNKPLSSNSRLLNLTPVLDEQRLMRVGGRIRKVDGVSFDTIQPVILDGRHKVAQLLVEYYHRRGLHGANELVVNELRQRYWLLRLRPTVRGIASRCLFCRFRRAAPKPQRMGDLPTERLQHNRRPFTFTGMDFFGPLDVTLGRRKQKRYGVIFTCLTIRAIHIEITDDLTTDSTIMALRRMVARRGQPSVIYSDNGTNLRGAATELKRSLEQLNSEKIEEDGTVRGIQWKFIPPGAPEMGGAWERMVRSVKTALRVILRERAPHPETLHTLLTEVEALVNSRPITHVSVDPTFPEALTPNHFLIGTSSNGPQLGKYDDIDLCLRKKWRIAQRLTDMFWGRWLREYLPSLLPRQKWFAQGENLREGDYVLLVEPNLERGQWRHGVVSATHAGDDGRVRVVDVRTRTGVLRRPVTRVALLEPKGCSVKA
jgi:transposase InsO family protein